MKNEIYDFIDKKGGGISFVELERIDGFKGDFEMLLEPKNIIFWQGINQVAITAINELLEEKRIVCYPSSVLVYLFDGKQMNLPICNKISFKKYKNPRWLPVVFWTSEQFQRIKK